MNAKNWIGNAWRARAGPMKAMRGQLGFALVQARQRPGQPGRAEEARVRVEAEARAALREWLMV